MLRVAILWHMHQPMYVDPAAGEAILPWVRFHATHSYFDMAWMLLRHPEVRVTVNFVPSLLDQLEAIAAGNAKERFQELIRRNADDLDEAERRFVVDHFFMVNHSRAIEPSPRYGQLLHQARSGGTFSADEIRDLQVLFPLAWIGFGARQDEPVLQELIEKGGGYTEADKAAFLEVQQSVVQRVLPMWRRLGERDQVEFSTTPYFHPILPLLCDSASARRAMPGATHPPRFAWPQDARWQVRTAIARHREMFGSPPVGMWPAEGAVSPEAFELLAAEGLRWTATDEGNLFRSFPPQQSHGGLYQPFSYEAAAGPITIFFRDRVISDRIGFSYANMSVKEAIGDLSQHFQRVQEEASAAGVREPVLSVILDGENAWESYPAHGEAFLEAFHLALTATPGIRTVTMKEAAEAPPQRLRFVHSGSWIDANYRVWIGHPEDNLAWELLGEVRAMLDRHDRAADVASHRLEQAHRLLLEAEGSDWFWWYGDDFETTSAAEFDLLFRDRLSRAAVLLGEQPPQRLSSPISGRARRSGPPSPEIAPPEALIHPNIDGRVDAWAEWQGAGILRPGRGRGAMHRSTAHVSEVRFGTDLEQLYLRLDPIESLDGVRLQILAWAPARAPLDLEIELATHEPMEPPVPGGRVAYRAVVELALPLSELGLRPGDRVGLLLVLRRGQVELERIPHGGALGFDLPDENFSSREWRV